MAARLIWSPQAADDLEAIVAHIARDSDHYAARVAADVLAAVERLATFPRLGRVVPEFDHPDVREVLSHSYRILYRVEADAVKIAAVMHGARDLRNALGDRSI